MDDKFLEGKRILFYVPEGNVEDNGVYASQVFELARHCLVNGAECLVFQYRPGEVDVVARRGGIQILNDTKVRHYVPIWRLPHFYRMRHSHVFDLIADFHPTHIYCRQYQTVIAARSLADILGAKLVYSVRGADVEERMLGRRFKDLVVSQYIKMTLRVAVRICDHLNTVTHVFSNLLLKRYGRQASVLPCCVADDKFVHPNERVVTLPPKSFKTLVYSGGLSSWQRIDDIIDLMKQIAIKDPTTHFLFLTNEQDVLVRKCKEHNLVRERWTSYSCKPNEVLQMLRKADVGIILRDDVLVNQVSSPIKIGEYLAAGLGVIASSCIGDVGKELYGQPFAKILDREIVLDDVIQFIKNFDVDKGNAAITFAKRHYTYAGNRGALSEMFA